MTLNIWSKWILAVAILTFNFKFFKNFSHSLDFHCLIYFAKSINLSWMVTLWCELLCKCSINTLKSDQWITIWWVKFELECLLLIFIYFNSIFKVTCKNGIFVCQYIRTHSEENRVKFLTLHSPFCLFLIKRRYLNLESTSLEKNIRCASKWFILTQRMQNPEFVHLKCVTYNQFLCP